MLKLKKLMPKDKKGAYGIEIASNVFLELFILCLLIIAIIVGAVAVKNSGLISTTAPEYNDTQNLINNMTKTASGFGTNFSTISNIVVVVIIFGFLGLMIYVVRSFAGKSKKGAG